MESDRKYDPDSKDPIGFLEDLAEIGKCPSDLPSLRKKYPELYDAIIQEEEYDSALQVIRDRETYLKNNKDIDDSPSENKVLNAVRENKGGLEQKSIAPKLDSSIKDFAERVKEGGYWFPTKPVKPK